MAEGFRTDEELVDAVAQRRRQWEAKEAIERPERDAWLEEVGSQLKAEIAAGKCHNLFSVKNKFYGTDKAGRMLSLLEKWAAAHGMRVLCCGITDNNWYMVIDRKED
jgi:hypothetical protein